MPLDAASRRDGNIRIENGQAVVVKEGDPAQGLRYTSHHATCPQGRQWRRGGSGRATEGLNEPAAMVQAIRETVAMLERDPTPKAAAYILLSAAIEVLLRLNVQPDSIRSTVDRLSREQKDHDDRAERARDSAGAS